MPVSGIRMRITAADPTVIGAGGELTYFGIKPRDFVLSRYTEVLAVK